MAVTTEIAPDVYRISIFAQWGNFQFNHFLVKDDEPLLFHTGLRGFHTEIREAVSKLIKLSDLRHISFSHFESDECGSLHDWLGVAPNADVICSQVGAMVNLNDFIGRDARGLTDGATFATGKYRFRYSVRICSITWATSNRSPRATSWAARVKQWRYFKQASSRSMFRTRRSPGKT
jgi:ODP family beta-lactamase